LHQDLVERLFAIYREPVYRFLRRLLRDTAVAEELTQDTFMRALGADYRADGHERAWIYQIARNLARDHVRARVRRPVALAEEPFADPDRVAAVDLNAALAALADEDREVFLMREVAGLSYAEIAAVCGTSLDAVRARLYRTRLTLRAALAEPARPIRRAGS
jgi:RNA polymerase sigma-70 factor (ECF subfamily)